MSVVHGTDPQNLIEKIVRNRIYQTRYFNEECFGLDAATLVDKAIELQEVLPPALCPRPRPRSPPPLFGFSTNF